ncbi:hypothetical protein BT67DRAFT_444089 [Trichocladium antarcticum]|uniref:Uncharacterized protein n=1 Tax=Trichocladium antarcticum TaxID=1450529 RepID=A0AAN6ZBU5_9PEZI|nr:hypothetical protein BT67DRAFT_444089 [Trichocladium antarcticum]
MTKESQVPARNPSHNLSAQPAVALHSPTTKPSQSTPTQSHSTMDPLGRPAPPSPSPFSNPTTPPRQRPPLNIPVLATNPNPPEPTHSNALPVQQQPSPSAKTTTKAPLAAAGAHPQPLARQPLTRKDVAPPPRAVNGEMAVFPINFFGDPPA